MILISDYKAPLGAWGAVGDLKQFLHRQNIAVRL
jgi:hypothetical protein